MEFNKNQTDVINYGKGTLLVEAGPGSGKTTVIVERIKHLIDNNVSPDSFLVITFTTKAADNLKTKLKQHLDKDDVDKMQISTIHSFCLEYLKSKNQMLHLLDDETTEKKTLFIQKFKEELGFVNENTLLNYQLPSAINKFAEYTSFNVKTDELVNNIKESRPVSDEYVKFVNSFNYFSKKRIDDADFKDDWYNARYLQIAKAYPKYLELLDEHNYVDYDTLQLKTLHYLEADPITQYTTVFVDEFQDTDPLQFRIFKILQKNAEYFTAVGDVDQHIYAFRSSFADYFDEMSEIPDSKVISLDVNYRSTENIVNASDSFIKHQRKKYSQKHLKSDNQKYNNPNFIIKSDNYDTEAKTIFILINELKNKNKISDYSDVAVLFRTHSNKTISALIDLFNINNIDYSIRGQKNLADSDEVKSLITLLWYIARKTNYGHVPTNDELKDLNLKAFCSEFFENTFYALNDSTKSYLNSLQDSYYDKIIEVRNDVRASQGRRKVKSYKTVKDEDLDTLFEIFDRIETPIIDLDEIADEKDREFFSQLETIKESIDEEEPPTILTVYYKLLSMGDFLSGEDYTKAQNLAQLTQTIYNYESFISNTDVRGLFYFLNGVIGNYASLNEETSGVQLMTVHAAKGLEFPVCIVTSLEEDKFPMKLKDPEREKNYIHGKETFYTPNEFLKYKNITLDEENLLDIEEEERIIYVAMTRAADLLILSCLGETPEAINNIKDHLCKFNLCYLDDIVIQKHFKSDDNEKLKLNYSAYSTYNLCPFMYNLIYNLKFRLSDENVTNLGTVFHEIMEEVNIKLADNQTVTQDKLDEITDRVYESFFEIDKTREEYEQLRKSVNYYFDTYSKNYDVVASELPFEIEHDNYVLNGAIDLVYKISDTEIGILDYKNAEVSDDKIRKYTPQLYTYASALSEMSEFKDFIIKESGIHFVKSDYKHVVEINEDVINQQLENLSEVASKIIEGEYPKRQTNFCKYCKFRVIC